MTNFTLNLFLLESTFYIEISSLSMIENATKYLLSLLSDEEANNKMPKDFVTASIEWINFWLPKEIFEKLSLAGLTLADKQFLLEEILQDLFKIPQFEIQLREKLNQYSLFNSSNAINNSTIAIQGDFSQTVNHYHGLPPQEDLKEQGDIKEVIKNIHAFVSAGQTDNALGILKQATLHDFPTLYKETIQISGVYSDLTRRERVGTISTEKSARMRAQINERVLNTADEMLKSY